MQTFRRAVSTLTVLVFSAAFALSAGANKEWVMMDNSVLVPNDANDGDSFHIRASETEYLIRLYLVDAPEIESVGASRLVEQADYFGVSVPQVIEIGRRAKQLVDQELSQPFTVATHMASGLGRSKIQRFYGFVRTKDGDLGELLIFNGLARIHGTRGAPPGVASSAEEITRLQDLERQAKEAHRGGWDVGNMAQQKFVPLPGASSDTTTAAVSQPAQGKTGKGKLTPGSAKLDANTASKEDLERIPGVGATMAERIIEARPFKSADDLRNVKGIGEGKRYEELRPYFQ